MTTKPSKPKARRPKDWAPRPRLTPELQSRIGAQLKEMYDDVVREGVPDRFASLLAKLDAPKDESR